ncbi:hypothetical protein [Clostridium sp. Marseille-QA1073]
MNSGDIAEGVKTVLSYGTVIAVIKTILSSGAFVAAIVAGFKYYYEKNREMYIRRLDKVYAPLYSYIVKQETTRYLIKDSVGDKEADFENKPILTWERKIKKYNENLFTGEIANKQEESSYILDRKYFIKICNDVDKGLMSPKLLNLINAYEILVYLEENLERGNSILELATVDKVEIEKKIVTEVIKGYKDLVDKLKIDKSREAIDINSFDISKL